MSKFQIGDRVAFRKGMVESYNVGIIRGFEPATPGSRDVCALVRVEGYGRGEHCSKVGVDALRPAPLCTPSEAYGGRVY